MKNKFIYIFVVCATLMTGCSQGENEVVEDNLPSATYEAVVESETEIVNISSDNNVIENNSEDESKDSVGLSNPIREVEKEEFEDNFKSKLNVPVNLEKNFTGKKYSLINVNYLIGSVDFIYKEDSYNYRLSAINMTNNIQDSKSLAGLYYEWTEQGNIPDANFSNSILLNDNGQGIIQWCNEGFTYSISMTKGATKEKLLYMYWNLYDNYMMYLSSYEGYLDEAYFLAFYDNYNQLDIDNDGMIDRIYRKPLENDKFGYVVEFGNGKRMSCVCDDIMALPVFDYLTVGQNKDSFIIYTEFYPTACGNPCFNPLFVFKENGEEYNYCEMPFSNQLGEESLIGVGIFSPKDNQVIIKSKEYSDFEKTLELSPEEYEMLWLEDKEKEEFVYRYYNIYRFEADENSDDTYRFYAYILDSKYICYTLTFDGTKWKIIDVFMTEN